jgi:hypothetical protein
MLNPKRLVMSLIGCLVFLITTQVVYIILDDNPSLDKFEILDRSYLDEYK